MKGPLARVVASTAGSEGAAKAETGSNSSVTGTARAVQRVGTHTAALVEIGAAYLVADRPVIALGFGENGRAGGRRERCSSTVMVP